MNAVADGACSCFLYVAQTMDGTMVRSFSPAIRRSGARLGLLALMPVPMPSAP